MTTEQNPNETPNPAPADPPPAPPAADPPAQPAAAPPAQSAPAVSDNATDSDLRDAVSTLSDIVGDLMGAVSKAADDVDNAPEKLPWHKRKWF